MKKKKNLILVGLIIFIATIVVLAIDLPLSPDKKTEDTLFSCSTLEELERFVEQNNFPHEEAGNTLHLYNVVVAGQTGYCVAEFRSNTKTLKKMTFYTIIENNGNVMEVIDNVRVSFCEEYGLDGEYEYYPLNDKANAVGENEFFQGEASKELFIYAEDATWNISWLITDDGVSAKICKNVA